MGLSQLKWIELPRFADARGILTSLDVLPFDVRNVFFLHSVISERGGLLNSEARRVVVEVRSRFSLYDYDGSDSVAYELCDAGRALYIPPMHWLRLRDFTPSAVCLVLTDSPHDDADYLRDWDEFLTLSRRERIAL